MSARAGTASRGNEFEFTVAAFFALRLLHHPEVEDFSFKCNDKNFGNVDDLIISLQLKNGEKLKFAFQLKHKENDKKIIQAKSLEANNGDYSLDKYRESFDKLSDVNKKNYHFILYTNIGFNLENARKLETFDISIITTCLGSKFFNVTKKDKNIFKFHPEQVNEDEFFSKFYFFSSQENLTGFTDKIKEFFRDQYFSNDNTALEYINFFRDWHLSNYAARKLKANVIKFQLLYLLFNPHLVPRLEKLKGEPEDKPVTHEEKLHEQIQEIFKEFDLTILEDIGENPDIKFLTESEIVEEKMELLLEAKLHNLVLKSTKQLTPEMERKTLVFRKQLPLIVRFAENSKNSVFAIFPLLRKEDNLKIVLLGKEIFKEIETRNFCSGWKICQTLYDLSQTNIDLYSKVIDHFKVSLQGRTEITIRTLIDFDEEVAKLVTMTELISLINNNVVGEKRETLPKTYVNRRLCKHCKPEIQKHKSTLMKYLKSRWPMELSSFEKTEDIGEITACRNLTQNLNVVCAQPGMGKSTMMKYFKNNCPTTHWPIQINFNEHQSIFKDGMDIDVVQYIFNFTSERYNYGNFTNKLRNIFYKHNRIIIYWDGLDELDQNMVQRATKIIKDFQSKRFIQWISSRLNLKVSLEKFFDILAFDIKEMNKKEQKKYIRNRLNEQMNQQQIDKVIRQLYGGKYLESNHKVLGTPLQIYMITEILLQNLDKPPNFIDEISVLTSMYRYFIQGKWRHFYIKNSIEEEKNKDLLESAQRHQFNIYRVLAIRSCFKSDLLKNALDSSVVEDLDKQSKTYLTTFQDKGDYAGFIVQMDEDSAIFEHNTFMEFFTAWWMTENLEHISKFKDFIFKAEYSNVRLFFDMLLAEKIPEIMAVLYNDMEKIKEIKEIVKDAAGRTPLHIACSWGTRLDPIAAEAISAKRFNTKIYVETLELHIFDLYVSLTDSRADKAKIEAIALLTIENDWRKTDDLYGWNAAQYADSILSLLPLEVISKSCQIDLKDFKNFRNLYWVSFNCVKYNCTSLFKQLIKVPFFYVVWNDFRVRVSSLYDCACDLNRKDIANLLKENSAYNKDIVEHSKLRNNFKVDRKNFWLFKPCDPEIHHHLYENATLIGKYMHKYDLNGKKLSDIAKELGCSHIITFCDSTVEWFAAFNDRLENDNLENETNTSEFIYEIRDADRIITEIRSFKCKVERKQQKFLDSYLPPNRDVNQCNEQGFSLLMVFAQIGNFDIVKLLVEKYNADININNESGVTAVILALYTEKLIIVEYLIARDAIIMQEYKFEKNILIYCAKKSYWYILSLLLEKYKMKLDMADENGNTELLLAALEGRFDMCHYLLNKGANKCHRNSLGETLFSLAAANENLEVIKTLINDFDINSTNTAGDSALLKAAAAADQNNFQVVEYLISKGANKYQRNNQNESLLSIAATKGNLKLVKQLIESGEFDINETDNSGESPLLKAANQNQSQVVDLLISNGANKQQINRKGQTLFLSAAKFGLLKLVKELIENDNVDVNQENGDGDTALLIAAAHDKIEIVEYLLMMGADKFKQNHRWSTPLLLACKYGNLKLIRLLADDNSDEIRKRDIEGDRAILVAARMNKFDIVEYLAKFCVRYFDEEFIFAAMHGNLRMVKKLLSHSDLNRNNTHGDPALLLAAKHNHFEVVDYLIAKGADLTKRNRCQETLFSFAAMNGNIEIVRSLLDHHINDINQVDLFGNTALLRAAANSNYKMVDFLISQGANQKIWNHDGTTLLHFAAKHGNLELVTRLVQNENFDVNHLDGSTNSPALLAAENNHFEVVKFLIDKGAEGQLMNKHKKSILSYAALNGNFEVVKLLMSGDYVSELCKSDAALCAAQGGHFEIFDYVVGNGHSPKNLLLEAVASHGRLDRVKMLIDEYTAAGYTWWNRRTVLLSAIKSNNFEVAKFLFEREASCGEIYDVHSLVLSSIDAKNEEFYNFLAER